MFSIICKELGLENYGFTITPSPKKNKAKPESKTPLQDLDKRIFTRLAQLKSKKNAVSEITFRNFSIDQLEFIRKKYKQDKEIKDIFNILKKGNYDPKCVILEEASSEDKSNNLTKDVKFSENDFKFVIISILDRVDATKNFKSLVLRNFEQKYLEALSDIKFPDRLNVRVEHTDKNMLEKLRNIKLQAKVDFSISELKVTDKKSKKNRKSKAVLNSSNNSEDISDIKTVEEASASGSEHDSNWENIMRKGEKDSNEQASDNSYSKLGSVGLINQATSKSMLNQSAIDVTPDAKVVNASNTSLDTFRIIKTFASDAEATLKFPNDTIRQSLNLINFLASVPLDEAEYVRNIQGLKKQIDTLNEQIQTKAVDQEKVLTLQEETNSLKQEKARLQADLINLVSGNESQLAPYVLQTSQLRENNQQLIYEIEDLKLKLSKQESSNKRRLAEEEGYTSNKVRRVENQHTVHNNNLSQNSPVASYNYSRPISNGPQFFSTPSITEVPRIYSSPNQQLLNNNGPQTVNFQALDTSSSNHSSPSQHFSERNWQTPRK